MAWGWQTWMGMACGWQTWVGMSKYPPAASISGVMWSTGMRLRPERRRGASPPDCDRWGPVLRPIVLVSGDIMGDMSDRSAWVAASGAEAALHHHHHHQQQ